MEPVSTRAGLAVSLETLYKMGAVGSLTDDQHLERFLARSDKADSEAAFAALVERHGTMVLSVCRRIVREPHDTDDAFQATFLVLARRARSILGRGEFAAWLFGIARRVALRARNDASRRRERLKKLGADRLIEHAGERVVSAEESAPDYSPLIAAIDDLPERLRAPVVLHYFQGLGTEAVARRLGCPRGTVLSRLARARERLRRRLERQYTSLELVLPAASISDPWFPSVTVPTSLIQSTVRAASCLALAGTAIEGAVAPSVISLSRGVGRTLTLAKARLFSALTVLGLAGAVIGFSMAAQLEEKSGQAVSGRQGLSKKSAMVPRAAVAPKTDDEPNGATVNLHGRVLGPDGKPVAGAQILLQLPVPGANGPRAHRRIATSATDGRFEASVPRKDLSLSEPLATDPPMVAALATGLGPDWIKLDPDDAGADLALRLRSDDVAIEGRLISPERKPLRDLTVSAASLSDFQADLIDKIRKADGELQPLLLKDLEKLFQPFDPPTEGAITPVRTDTNGGFRLTGIGRDRMVVLRIEGASVERSSVLVCTSSDPAYVPVVLPLAEPGEDPSENKVLGPRFESAVQPERVIEGTIRDSDSGKPIPGVQVASWNGAKATSDAQGRFKLTGQPRKPGNEVEFTASGQPYIDIHKTIDAAPDPPLIHLEVALVRGVWVEGRVKNKRDGRPLKANIGYFPARDNPHLKQCPDAAFLRDYSNVNNEIHTDGEGKFRAVVFPGDGILAVRALGRTFLSAKPLSGQVAVSLLEANPRHPYGYYHAFVSINPGDVERIRVPDIEVIEGRLQHVQIVNPDGLPVTGARLSANLAANLNDKVVNGNELTFVHPQPGNHYSILVVNQEQTAGTLLVVKSQELDPIVAKLQSAGTVVGRLVDEQGRPRPNVPLSPIQFHGNVVAEASSVPFRTGPDGRFRITGLIPGVSYNVQDIGFCVQAQTSRQPLFIGPPDFTMKPGETQNWGDVRFDKRSE